MVTDEFIKKTIYQDIIFLVKYMFSIQIKEDLNNNF